MISCGFLVRLKREFSPHFARLLASLCDEGAGGGCCNSRSGDITLVVLVLHTAGITGVQKLHWCVYFVWLGVIPVVATFYQVSFIGHTSANKPSLHCHHHHHHHHHHHQPDQHHHLYVRADLARCMGELVIGQARQRQVDNRDTETQVDHIRLTTDTPG